MAPSTHSRDRRVYVLGDSVYSSIAYCDGFAMEVDPGDLIDSMLEESATDKLSVSYKNIIENEILPYQQVDFAQRAKLVDSLMKTIQSKYRDLSTRDIVRLIRASNRRKKNDMSTLLDLYLFDLAKKQGKLVGGVEDLAGRRLPNDEMEEDELRTELFLKAQKKKYADLLEWMIETYEAADLDKMHEFSIKTKSPKGLTAILYNRNAKIAKRIDSLGRIRPTFFAVGTGHLPGDSGLIDLLTRSGYQLTPVFSSRKIEPEDYRVEKEVNQWNSFSDADSSYIVQLPGKPTSITALTNQLLLKTYKELSNEVVLMAGVYEDGYAGKNLASVFDELKLKMSRRDIKLTAPEKITRQGVEGYDFTYREKNLFARLHLFYYDHKTFLFGIGAKTKDSLQSAKCRYFLDHYQMLLNRRTAQSMISFTSPEKQFSVKLPLNPKIELAGGTQSFTKETVFLYNSLDLVHKLNYLVLVKEPVMGYFAEFDTSLFYRTAGDLINGFVRLQSRVEAKLDGQPAMKYVFSGESAGDSVQVNTIVTRRNNRIYCLSLRGPAIAANQSKFDAFVSSFQFMPYQNQPWAKVYNALHGFSVEAPAPVKLMKTADSSFENIPRQEFFTYDSVTSVSYGITRYIPGRYYYTQDATTLLNEFCKMYIDTAGLVNNITNANDSVLANKAVKNGVQNARELIFKERSLGRFSRLRFLLQGENVYVLNLQGDEEVVTNAAADRFFNSFRFDSAQATELLYKSKTAQLIRDLQFGDSLLRLEAMTALQDFHYPQSDLPLLRDAILLNFPVQSRRFLPTADYFIAILAQYYNPAALQFISTNYPLLKGKSESVRMKMLNALAGYASEDAYALLKTYLLSDLPAEANLDVATTLINASPSLAVTLFPDITAGLKNPLLKPFILDIASNLVDSNLLSPEFLKTHEQEILSAATQFLTQYREYNAVSFYLPHIYPILKLLLRSDHKTAKRLVTDFLDLFHTDVTQSIIVDAAILKKEIPGDYYERHTSNPQRRLALYEALRNAGRREYFKGEFASQRAFAETFVTLFAQQRIPSEEVKKDYFFVSIKEVMVKGEMKRFYVYKVVYHHRYATQITTEFIGPFSLDNSEFSISPGQEKYTYYQKFDPKDVDKFFAEFIKQVNSMP